MSVEVSNFGYLQDGQAIKKVVLKSVNGTAVSVLTYGATIQAIQVRNKDVVLGYDTIADYEKNDGYLGATIGRVANRIADGCFTMNGEEIQLACNEKARNGHLHGGICGFDKKVWNYTILREGLDPSVRFDMVSEDGEENYPGRLEVSVTFSVNSDNVIELSYRAVSDKDTPVNLTNHTYFNLNGYDGANVLDTQIKLLADEYTPVNDVLIPTGEFANVEGTPLDLRQVKTIGEVVNADHPQIAGVGGIDHNFVLAHEKRELTEVVWAYSCSSGIRMICSTDLPGVQVYTGNFLDGAQGKNGSTHGKHQGFCLETQYFPDSVNHSNFPSILLKAGEEFTTTTTYRFDRNPIE